MSLPQTVVCPGCTCLCDDIELKQNGPSVLANNACEKGKTFFDSAPASQSIHYVENRSTSLETAVDEAAKILNRSQAPLIFGIDQLATRAQQSAWKLADMIGATIDSTTTNHHRASMFALQRIGKVTASIGEMANRSDLIAFWFCDPARTHPRLLDRLCRDDGVRKRIIVIDEKATATSEKADEFLAVRPDKATAFLAVLRAMLKGTPLETSQVLSATGLELNIVRSLAEQFRTANYGSMIFGQTNIDSAFDPVTDSLTSLIRELNDLTRFVGAKLRSDANAQSAENVLAWSSGYPFAVNLNRRLPRFNWLEHSAETVLRRAECDAVLFATGVDRQQAFEGLSKTSREHLEMIPTISISPIASFPSTISIHVGIPGIHCDGEFCRFDNISLPLTGNPVQPFKLLNAEVVLNTLLDKLRTSERSIK